MKNKKIRRDTDDLNQIFNHLDLQLQNTYSFQACGMFIRVDHMLSHKKASVNLKPLKT